MKHPTPTGVSRSGWLALTLACLLVGTALLGGFRPQMARADEMGEVPYRTPEEPLPDEVAAWRDTYRQHPGLFRLTVGDTTYLLISWGEKRTGGYGMALDRIRREGEFLVAEVTLTAPGPGDIVTQVITYPHLLVALPATEAPFAAEFKGASWAPPGEGLPLCSPNLFVSRPLPLTPVSGPLRVTAVVRRTLGTVRVSIEDGHDVLGTATVEPGSAGTWASLAVDLNFRPASNPFGHLIFSVKDATTGRWVEEMGVPVRFATGVPADFPDVEGHWGAGYIRRALARGFVNGYPDGRFHPDDEITRAQFLRIVTTARGLLQGTPHAPTPTGTSADTIPARTIGDAPSPTDTAGHWAAPYIDAALSAGVLRKDDYPDGRFQPDLAATRLEMVVWLIRALGKEEQAGSAESRESARGYRDYSNIPDGLRGYVGLATQLGITTGVPGSLFAPNWHATRAQATVMILRALDTREAAEAALAFFRRWGELDLEGMKTLMLPPPEKFIPDSDIVFAPFYPKKYPEDLPEFLRASRDLVNQYDADAWKNARVMQSRADPSAGVASVRVELRLGRAPYQIWADMELTDETPAVWRLRMIDSLPITSGVQVPPSSYSLERLQPMDVRDLDGQPGAEILGWAFWGEYEGMGREPSGARGLFSMREGKIEKLWFTREGPAPDRVWTGEGVMGHLTAPDALDLLLVSRPANLDGRPVSPDGPQLGLYRLRTTPGTGNTPWDGEEATAGSGHASASPEKVADVAWPGVAPAGTSVYYGLMAARPLDATPGDEVVISAFCTPPQGAAYQLVVICRLEGTSLRVLGTHRSPAGQSLYLTFAEPPAGQPASAPHRLYVWTVSGEGVTALTFRDGKPVWEPLPVACYRLLAAADLDGDDRDEFLVETARHRLQLLDAAGRLLWETTAYKDARHAWTGQYEGRAVMVLAEAGADGTRVVRWEAGRPAGTTPTGATGGAIPGGQPGTDTAGITFERTWESPLLGRFNISALWVKDLDGDGDLELVVASTDNHLAPADYLHVFDLRQGWGPR
ncbi:MAG: S-layer homology domain-containing protein [Bacillota bacterium]|nr:S-layer homology domain-containing protein [Bacillota bacterium]